MANGTTKRKESRGGKKVTTKKVTPTSYSKKTVVKAPRKTSLKSSTSSSKKGVSKISDKQYKSASSMGGTRKSNFSLKDTYIDKGNRSSASYIRTKSSKVKNPRKTQVKSSTYGSTSSRTYTKDRTITSRTGSNLEKETSYKAKKSGSVKAKGSIDRYSPINARPYNIGTTKSYKYTKKPSGSTKLKQSSSTFSGEGYTTKVDKYKGGKLVNSKTKTKTYKKK